MTDHDPLDPPLDDPTPPEVVAKLTRSQRETRLVALERQAWQIVDLALATHLGDRELVHRCVMFSGGNDSTVGFHLFRHYATHAVHADTGTGVAETQEFVRDVASGFQVPLMLRRSEGASYADLVMGRVPKAFPGGFPGGGGHGVMITRLKERAWDVVRARDLPLPRRGKARLFLAFRRRTESERRKAGGGVPLFQRDGTVVWAAPLANWSKLDLNTYRLVHPSVPVNEVSDLLHMSGECLCGSYAQGGELERLGDHFPKAADPLRQLERELVDAGMDGPTARWGHGLRGRELAKARTAWACGACESKGTGGDLIVAR